MKRFLWGILAALAAACSPASNLPPPLVENRGDTQLVAQTEATTLPEMPGQEATYVADLPDYGAAPELNNETWLNVDAPLRLAGLKGKVVLLDMWTFDCINCIHIIPYVRDWHEKYADQGLVIIGNHFPEFSYEHDLANLREAIDRLDVPYAVAQDNDGATWNAYNNRYWPTVYLIDKRGHIRHWQIGEGGYEQTEAAIQALLAETEPSTSEPTTAPALTSITPTTTLNVRNQPNTDSSVIGSVEPGDVLVVRGKENGWYRVRYNDSEGYLSAEYVTVSTS